VPLVDCWISRRIICLSVLSYTATGVVSSVGPVVQSPLRYDANLAALRFSGISVGLGQTFPW